MKESFMTLNLNSNSEQPSGPSRDAEPESGEIASEKRGDIDVFGYDDYRAFMRERFAELQSRDLSFSQRGLARKAQIANPGFFNEVIRGRRRLSPAAAAKMAFGLELSPLATEFFLALVNYSEARDPVTKLKAGRRMMALKNRRLCHAIQGIQSHSEILRQILQELEKDWELQAAGLREDPATQDSSDSVLDPMNESTLQGILEKLVCLREKAGTTQQTFQISLVVAPRMDTAAS